MKIVRVQYTAKQDYVETNKANISNVMEELRKLNNKEIKYSVFLAEDGRSFMHFAMFENDEGQKVLNGLESFKKFTSELQAKGLDAPPKAETMNLVNSSYNIF